MRHGSNELVCKCHDGYEGNPYTLCEDIDECDRKLDICDSFSPQEVCINTNGSYGCDCPTGFERNETTGFCDDINECLNITIVSGMIRKIFYRNNYPNFRIHYLYKVLTLITVGGTRPVLIQLGATIALEM